MKLIRHYFSENTFIVPLREGAKILGVGFAPQQSDSFFDRCPYLNIVVPQIVTLTHVNITFNCFVVSTILGFSDSDIPGSISRTNVIENLSSDSPNTIVGSFQHGPSTFVVTCESLLGAGWSSDTTGTSNIAATAVEDQVNPGERFVRIL
jgi:hypothetical protein